MALWGVEIYVFNFFFRAHVGHEYFKLNPTGGISDWNSRVVSALMIRAKLSVTSSRQSCNRVVLQAPPGRQHGNQC